ncbi:MAG: YIP1 family protein, partial [Cystobacter sp.]
MPLPCPFCQRPFAPGATACPACGASLLLESLPGDTRPVCAVHPTLRSLGTCERCGAFACAQCLRPGPQGKTVCANCQPREPDQLLPWDRREELGLVPALWKTLLEVLLRPGTFSQTRAEGRTSESLLFVLLCSIPACFVTGVTYLLLFTFMPALAMELSETNRAVGDATGLAMMRWMGVGMLVTFTLFGPLAS